MKSRIENGNLVIELPLEKPTPSASGKTLLVASTRGVKQSTAKFKGQAISVVANAFIFPNDTAPSTGQGPSKSHEPEQGEEEEEPNGERDAEQPKKKKSARPKWQSLLE